MPNIKICSMPHTPDYEVRWQNFKGFVDTGWRKIKPITILIGPNNSGKTSFIDPFLLMNQTITSIDPSSPLIIRGRLYDGGNIKELVNNYDLSKNFTFGFKYHVHTPDKKLGKIGQYPPGAVDVTFGVNNETDREVFVKNETVYDIYHRPFFRLTRNHAGNYLYKGIAPSKMNPREVEAIKKSNPVNFLFSPNSLLSSLSRLSTPDDAKYKSAKFTQQFSNLLQVLSFSFSQARNVLADSSYIGPIRENPKRFYELKNENFRSVGSRGENFADLLKKNHKLIEKELNEWVKKFEFGDKLELIPLSKTIYSIIFRNNNEEVYTNIANAGFGASQILPLIVQALVSVENSLTIAEQPEIHLNPRLQGLLADLFAYMVKKGQRVIVETHSEHLLLRLRTLLAYKAIDPDDIAVYFIEKNMGISTIKEINIEGNGSIKPAEWPKGFFADTLKESLALASAQAKLRKK